VTRSRFWFSACLVALATISCSQKDSAADTAPAARVDSQPAAAASEPQSTLPRIVMLGDSLTAGLGLPPNEAYPALIQQRLDAEGLKFQVVNAGVSGDTSAGGLRRLDWALDGDVRVLVVALGGNDGLRGLPASELRQNLSTIVERAQARHIQVVLAGMEAPPNFGKDYTLEFRRVYAEVAKKYNVPLLPFLLDRVAGNDALNQRDGIHPTAEGARLVADNVWSVLKPLLDARPPRT
jgi:acyl-CoA thioesterase I